MTTLLSALAITAGGCAALPLAALGTVLGVGASAVSTGASVYSLGKLNSAELASADQVRHAAEHAADELDLHVVDGAFDASGLDYAMHLVDRSGGKVEIIVQERSARLTRLRVDVGLFGNEPTARLILERVRARLPAASTRPVALD